METGYKVVWRSPQGFAPCVTCAPIIFTVGQQIKSDENFGAFTLFKSLISAKRFRSRKLSPTNHAILRCEYEPTDARDRDTTRRTLWYRIKLCFKPSFFSRETKEKFEFSTVRRDGPVDTLPGGTVFAKSLTPMEIMNE